MAAHFAHPNYRVDRHDRGVGRHYTTKTPIRTVIAQMTPSSYGSSPRILVVEPLTLVRTCLTTMMSQIAGPVDEAETACQAFSMAAAVSPELVLLDVRAAKWEAGAVIRKFKQRFPEVRILAMLAQESDHYADECAGAGADACIFFTATRDELAAVANSLLAGPLAKPANLHNRRARDGGGDARPETQARLTARENQVLGHIAQGLSSREIAALLGVSVSTVQRHRFSLMSKLRLHNAASLTAYFMTRNRERAPLRLLGKP